jgi:hypothetical protein
MTVRLAPKLGGPVWQLRAGRVEALGADRAQLSDGREIERAKLSARIA